MKHGVPLKNGVPTTLGRIRQPAKSCPRCRSDRYQSTHRRAAFDYLLYALGAELRRCRDCRLRHASFTTFSVPLREPRALEGVLTGIFVMGSGFLVCLLFVWGVIRGFAELSG
jgi:hypothetical protein